MIEFIFVGLIAFVTDQAGIHVLLPNTKDPWRASDTCIVPHHLAFVAVNIDALAQVPGNLCAQDVQNLPPNEKPGLLASLPNTTCTWVLDHEDISLEGALTALSPDPPTSAAADLVKLETVLPETGSVKGHYLDPKPDISLLIGRVALAGQGLSLQGLSVCQAPVDFYPLRRPLPHYPEQAPPLPVADLTYLKGTVTDGIVLHLKKFDSLDSGRTIKLKQPGPMGSVVVIAHLAIADSMAAACDSSKSSVHPDSGSFDRHFEVFYRMAAREPWQDDRLVPFAKCKYWPIVPPQYYEFINLMVSPVPESICILDDLNSKGFGQRIICPQAAL
jgi:hypothetical protein